MQVFVSLFCCLVRLAKSKDGNGGGGGIRAFRLAAKIGLNE